MISLNDEQLQAIHAKSPTMVNASAGSGKTRCLIAKIIHELETGTEPGKICALTFTNKAAKEMKDRISKQGSTDGMQVSTIHSMCVRIIQEWVKYTPLKKPFTIYDTGNQLSIIKTILKARDLPDSPNDVLSAISRAKSDDVTKDLEGLYQTVYTAYQQILHKNNACDFDDLLLYARDCLKQEDCRNTYIDKWSCILVDEFQDTSTIQFQIIMSLYDPARTKTFFAVGDLNQSIYSWRSARPSNMQDFVKSYNPVVCDLTYNYRSSSEIIKMANGFLQFGKTMVPKSENKGNISLHKFDSQDHEAEKLAQAILQMGNYEETAILYRVNSRSLLFERAFSKYKIPYKVVGDLPFFQRRVVKDILSMIRAANNPDDVESLSRIINTPKRGFGDAKKERLLMEGRTYAESISVEMPAIREFLDLLDKVKGMVPSDAVTTLIEGTGYRESLTRDPDINMLNAFRDMVVGYRSNEELMLASTFLEQDSGRGVKLMTAHASKGLEFDRVFVVGVESGVWPHKMSTNIDEEKRLYYVAVTRARRYLNISFSRSKTFRGTHIETYPSQLFKTTFKNLYGREMK